MPPKQWLSQIINNLKTIKPMWIYMLYDLCIKNICDHLCILPFHQLWFQHSSIVLVVWMPYCVNLTVSLRKLLFKWRCDTWFWCIFDALYTRLKFLSPSPYCVIRHTRRPISSREFSDDQPVLSYLWCKPVFYFLSTLLPTIFTTVVNDCVYLNSKLYVLHLI
jgi:hypothetical protein